MGIQDPDEFGQFTRVSRLLRKSGLKPDEANELTELIRDMPASSFATEFKVLNNILESQNATLRAELQAQKEILDARLESQDSKYNQMRWFIAILLAAGVLNVLATLFGWGAA